MNLLRQSYWSPYLAGILIGVLQIPIFLLLHASIGTSGSFNSVVCSILTIFSGTDSNIASKCFPALKNWWQLGFVVGIFCGAYLSAKLAGTRKTVRSAVWEKVIPKQSIYHRIIMAFSGGFIMLLGARIADGCTSGNGISGIGLLSIGSMIVIGAMFVAGILVVSLYKRI